MDDFCQIVISAKPVRVSRLQCFGMFSQLRKTFVDGATRCAKHSFHWPGSHYAPQHHLFSKQEPIIILFPALFLRTVTRKLSQHRSFAEIKGCKRFCIDQTALFLRLVRTFLFTAVARYTGHHYQRTPTEAVSQQSRLPEHSRFWYCAFFTASHRITCEAASRLNKLIDVVVPAWSRAVCYGNNGPSNQYKLWSSYRVYSRYVPTVSVSAERYRQAVCAKDNR